MTKYRIGKVIGVFGDKIEVSLDDFMEEDNNPFGVPETMQVNVTTDSGPVPLLIGQPGSFIKVQLPSKELLIIVTDIVMRQNLITASEHKESEKLDFYPIESPKRYISGVPVGTIDPTGSFERGTDILPTVNSNVYAVSNETINTVYLNYAQGDFSIGRITLVPQQEAKINLDFFLSRHVAILGQTGCGKSWTIASILEKISRFPKSTLILFDLHGEYQTAFGDYAEYVRANDLELPYWLMNCEELIELMVDRSDSNAPNQVAKFKELLQKEKESHEENTELDIPKITVDTPVFFNFQNIIEEFSRLDQQMVQGSRGPKQGPLFGRFTRLLMRMDSKLGDRRYDLIFHPQKYKTSASMEDLFRKILSEELDNLKKLVVIDMSPIPFDVRESVISLILRCIFDFGYWYKRVNNTTLPIAIFCDEAHAYFSSSDSSSPSRRSAERIAKEGRKYGISLTVISQRPRELSSTILAQCGTFMCLRITNPDDQAYVKNLLPESVKGITSMFSTLRAGECILLGDSVIMPTRIKIDPPSQKPTSADTSFYDEWHQDHTEIDFHSILEAWRKQMD